MRKFGCRAAIIHTQMLISLERKAATNLINHFLPVSLLMRNPNSLAAVIKITHAHNTSGTVIFGQSAIRSGGGADECDLTLMHRSGERASFPLSDRRRLHFAERGGQMHLSRLRTFGKKCAGSRKHYKSLGNLFVVRRHSENSS
jgi:hypothetical protein